MIGRHGRHMPYINIRSTPAGQQLTNLKSHKVTLLCLVYKKNGKKKLEGAYFVPPPYCYGLRKEEGGLFNLFFFKIMLLITSQGIKKAP